MLPSKFLENRLLKDIFHSINQNNYNISCFYQQKVSEVIEKRNLKKLLTVLTLEEINALSEKNQKDSNLQAEASI
jgi:molybdopterin-guanine dinucleotide biosynthesis protein A